MTGRKLLCARSLRERFILNFQGTTAAIDAELSTCFMGSAWRILWALFEDHGLKPEDVEVGCDGLAGDFAHV